MHDVFISYPHLDKEPVLRIKAALEARGLAVWIDEDRIRPRASIQPWASIQKSIDENLAISKVVLAYYSQAYRGSRACQWELTAAFLTAQGAGEEYDRVLVVNPEPKAEHILPVTYRDQLFHAAPSAVDEAEAERIAQGVAGHVASIDKPLGELRSTDTIPYYPHKPQAYAYFVGRYLDMWRVHEGLHAADAPMITGAAGGPLVQVRGNGGLGKTLLAQEYALRYAAGYPGGVYWLRAYGSDDLRPSRSAVEIEATRDQQWRGLAAGLGVAAGESDLESIAGRIKKKLEEIGKPYLWVVDDFPAGTLAEKDDKDGKESRKRWNELQEWLAPTGLGRTLITTRSREHDGIGKEIDLEVLEPEDAYQLLISRHKPGDAEDEAAARELVEDLGRHALAIDVTASAVTQSAAERRFVEWRDRLRKPSEDELEYARVLAPQLPTGHEKSIAATLLRSIALLDEDGLDFLRLASVLGPAPIPAALVDGVFAAADGRSAQDARRKGERARAKAERLSLCERADADGRLAHTVHALVNRTVRFKEGRSERRARLREAALDRLVADGSRAADIREHAHLREWIVHARELGGSPRSEREATLAAWVARHDYERGLYPTARRLFEEVSEVLKRILGAEHPSTLTAMGNLAGTLYAQGDLAGARRLEEEVSEVLKRILGAEHPSTLTAMGNLAGTLKAQGDLAGARRLQEEVSEVRKRTLGAEHPATLTAMNNLAQTLYAQGDLAGARRLQEEVSEVLKWILGAEHPSTLTAMGNLAGTLKAQGDLAGARRLEEEVSEVLKRTLGAEHPSTLTAMNNLAGTLKAQGDLAGARRQFEEVSEVRKRTLGAEHPSTLTAMGNLAATLYAQGDLAGARRLEEEVSEVLKRTLGAEHSDTLVAMGNLAGTLYAQGDLAGARRLFEEVSEVRKRTLGAEHPDTLGAMGNLAGTLYAQGDLAGARRLEEEVSEVRKRTLGAEHPDTLASLADAALTARKSWDLKGACDLWERVVLARTRVLGAEHPDTLQSRHNWATALRYRGDFADARRCYEEAIGGLARVFGDAHPKTEDSVLGLAVTAAEEGSFREARPTIERIAAARVESLGAEHPNTLWAQDRLVLVLLGLGEANQAAELLDRVVERGTRAQGAEHRATLNARAHLAAALRARGALTQARAELDATLEAMGRTFDEDDPERMLAIAERARVLRDQGEPDAAREQLRFALEGLVRKLGPEHYWAKRVRDDLQTLERG